MIRKFYCNNYLKGRIISQMQHYIDSQAIQFEVGNNRNTCIVTINEDKIQDKHELDYIYKKLVPTNREIKEERR